MQKKLILSLAIVLACFFTINIMATTALDQAQQQEFEAITKRLRCVTCPNQSIADSGAPIAESMREKVQELILAGQSKRQIEAYFVERYGDYVLYQPPVSYKTLGLWFAPAIFLLIGFIALFKQLTKQISRK